MLVRRFSFCLIILALMDLAAFGDINLFLNVKGRENVILYIKEVYASAADKGAIPLSEKPVKIAAKSGFGQVFVGRVRGRGLRISTLTLLLDKVYVSGEEVKLCSEKVELPVSVKVDGNNASLFMVWHVKEGLGKSGCYNPVFSVYSQTAPMEKEILTAVCSDADTLFFVRTDTNWVEASFSTASEPEDVSMTCDNNLVLVLSEGDKLLQLISVSPLRSVDLFPLPFVISPSRMAMIKDGMVVITDRDSGYILVLRAKTGEIVGTKRIGFGIADVVADSDKEMVAVSVPDEQKVYLFNFSLAPLGVIRVSGKPYSLWIDGGYIYITNVTTGNVDVYDLNTLKHKASVYSGRAPVDLLDTGDKVYVSNKNEGTITVFDKKQYVRLRKIEVGKSPEDMSFFRMRNWLYVILEGEEKIAVVDTVRDRLIGKIDLGCCPSAIYTNPETEVRQSCW
ncbi:MAG: hypothetical protein GXO44_05450 [Deferribacteres bacterium]|nr:hypothetical protein [Deferribacteres bacterium]